MKRSLKKYVPLVLLESVTICLCSKGSWLTDNLSILGNIKMYRPLFYMWMILYAWNFYYPFFKSSFVGHFSILKILLSCSLITMILAVILPFDSRSYDLCSLLHVPSASASLILYGCFIIKLLNALKEKQPYFLFSLLKHMETAIAVIGIGILIFEQINGIIECLFTAFAGTFIIRVYAFLKTVDDIA